MIPIQPQYLTLTKLLDKRLFQIPEYQRAYSWTRHQRSDLFTDLEKTQAKGGEETHFMATIVCLRERRETLGTDEFDVMQVVDGQQRLTTLIILLRAISLKLDESDPPQAKLNRELQELLVKVEGHQLLLLQTNHDTSQYFANFLRKGTTHPASDAKTLADREILQAMKDCQDFVQKWIAGGQTLLSLVALLKNRLFFLLHEIAEQKTVYTVFEVLNSRGLDVSWLDRLKSILMGAVFDLKSTDHLTLVRELHAIWKQIYSVIGLRQGLSTEALRFAATLRTKAAPSRSLGEEDAVDSLRSEAVNAKGIRDVASWLLSVTKACDDLLGNARLTSVTQIVQARLLAAAINLRDDLGRTEKERLLKRWEKVSFRIYGMLGNDARTRVGEYIRLAWRVVNDKLSADAIDTALAEIGKLFTIDDAVHALQKANCYDGWNTELRYILYRYEEHLAKTQNLNFENERWAKIWAVSPSESIEHIWARSKAPEGERHRLGSLLLLPPGLNSKLQDKDPALKADSYTQTGLLIAAQVARTINDGGWNENAIQKREEEILTWARTEWAD